MSERKTGKESELNELKKKCDSLLEIIKEKDALLEKKEEEIKRLEEEKKDLAHRLEKERASILLKAPTLESTLATMIELMMELNKAYREEIRNATAGTIVFTHCDGDGICCGALYERFFGENFDWRIFHISQSERYLIKKVRPKRALHVADLSIDEELAKHILNIAKSGVDVKWIDHHKESINLRKEILDCLLDKKILIYEDTRSAANLVRSYIRLDDEISKRICLIADRCDGERSKGREVEEDAIAISKLSYLGNKIASEARKELAQHGSIKSSKLKEKVAVIDLLTAYGKKVLTEKIFYNGKNFQVYYLTHEDPHLIGIGSIIAKISNENQKDVYAVIQTDKSTSIKGRVKAGAESVFSKIVEKFGGSKYSRADIGGYKSEKIDLKEFVNLLKNLYAEAGSA
jgi:oligoribonuclease NrnB/cAMP/cGMP phosphodiesterase (DHH superfamily)